MKNIAAAIKKWRYFAYYKQMTTEELEQRMPSLRAAAMRTAERFFGKGEEAEDVAQECCIWLYLRCRELRSEDVERLAYMVAKNLCVSEMRKRARMSVLSRVSIFSARQDSPPEIPHEQTPVSHTIENENQRLLAEALEKLPQAWQRILRMQSETEMTARQMAVVLGIKPESVSVMLSAARRRLYEILKEHIQR